MGVETLLVFILFFVLLLTRAPLAIVLGSVSTFYIFYFTTLPLTQITNTMFSALESFSLMAVPLFIFAATLMSRGGISQRLVDAANAVVGGLPGGLAMTSVLSCMFFAAISGSSVATVVAIGSLLIPSMIKSGYGREFSTGIVTTSGSLGILIPPSIPLIVYGVVAETSISDLFTAGIIPGIFTGFLLMGLVAFIAWRRRLRTGTAAMTVGERLRALGIALPGLLLPVVILGGIYGGIFSPTEAAGIAILYAFVVGMFIYRDLNLRDLPEVLTTAARQSAMIMFVIANGYLFAFFLATERIPGAVGSLLTSADLPAWGFLVGVNILLLIVGCFMETSSAIVILTPILVPVALELGINPVHLGIVIVMNLELGLLTPPVGLNLFVASGLSNMSVLRVAKAALPSFMVLLVAVLIVTYVPEIALALVESSN